MNIGNNSQKFKYQSVIACIVSLLIVGLFEVAFRYYYRWPWLLKHKDGLALEVGFDVLICGVVLVLFIPQWRKWLSICIVVNLAFILIPLLGGIDPPPPPPPGDSPIAIDTVFEILKNDELTDLQKSEFLKKHIGKIVTWTGYLHSLREDKEVERCFLEFQPVSQIAESTHNLVTAIFSQSEKGFLVDVNMRDWVKIRGKLHIDDTGTVSLNYCKMTNWHPMPKNMKKMDTNDYGRNIEIN